MFYNYLDNAFIVAGNKPWNRSIYKEILVGFPEGHGGAGP